MKSSEESAQAFLTDLQRLALEAYPNVVARANDGGRPAVAAEDRALESEKSTRSIHQWNANQTQKISDDTAEDTTIEDLYAIAASKSQ